MEFVEGPTLADRIAQGQIPEQARRQAVDKRTDIWAFGFVLYELLFARPTITDTLAAIVEREPVWDLLPVNTPPRPSLTPAALPREGPPAAARDVGDVRLELDEALSEAEHRHACTRSEAQPRYYSAARASFRPLVPTRLQSCLLVLISPISPLT